MGNKEAAVYLGGLLGSQAMDRTMVYTVVESVTIQTVVCNKHFGLSDVK